MEGDRDRIKVGTVLGSTVYVGRTTWERMNLQAAAGRTEFYIATNIVACEPRKDPSDWGNMLPFAYVRVDMDDKATIEKDLYKL